jgi:antitoxin HicB
MLRYPVVLKKDTNGTTLVSFPDFPTAHTFGDDPKEAITRATELLTDVLADYIERRQDIPIPSPMRKKNQAVELPLVAEAKIGLYRAMRAGRVGKAELARRLNCHMPQVDRLLDLSHSSRLDQIESALSALNKKLTIEIHDAA